MYQVAYLNFFVASSISSISSELFGRLIIFDQLIHLSFLITVVFHFHFHFNQLMSFYNTAIIAIDFL